MQRPAGTAAVPRRPGASRGTPIAFIRAIVLACEQAGKDPAGALRRAQIPAALLHEAGAQVSAHQMEAMSAAAMQELDDEALGWFSRRLPWGSMGMLCRASLPSPDLQVALGRWCRHHGLLVDDIRIELRVDGPTACIAIAERQLPAPQRELCLVSTLRHIHGLACWLVDAPIPLIDAAFPYPAPLHADAYASMFCGAIAFDAPGAALRFDARCLALPLRRTDDELREMLLRPLPLMVWPYRIERRISCRVRDLLRRHGPASTNAQAVAFALNVSVRTLHRYLAEESASLQGLKDELRREIAIDRLTRTSKPLKQVAAAAGYRSKASFNRAFRNWTGHSPGAYRQPAA